MYCHALQTQGQPWGSKVVRETLNKTQQKSYLTLIMDLAK